VKHWRSEYVMRCSAFFLHFEYSVDKNRRKYHKTDQHLPRTRITGSFLRQEYIFTLSLREKLLICRITCTLREDRYTFLIIYCSFLRKRNVSEESGRENQNTHFMLNNFFFFLNLALYEIMWKNIIEPAGHR
jgi:hypothetical protein